MILIVVSLSVLTILVAVLKPRLAVSGADLGFLEILAVNECMYVDVSFLMVLI